MAFLLSALNSIRIPLERQLIVLPIETVNLLGLISTLIWNPLTLSLPCPSLRSRIALSMLAYKVHNYPVNFPNYPHLLHSFTTHSPSHYVLTIVLTRDTPPPIRQRAKLSHIACVTIRCDMRHTNWNFVSDLLHMAGTMNNPTQRQFHYNNIKIKSTIFFSFNRLISDAATRKHF